MPSTPQLDPSPATTARPPTARRSRSLGRNAFLAGLAATALCLGATASAQAAQFSPFSRADGTPLVTTNIGFGDCRITVGPVFDTGRTAQTYRVIGGAQVNCSSQHNSIAVTVREFASDGLRSWQVGSGIGTTFRNSYGFGTKILALNLGCQPRAYHWTTGAYVTVDGRASGWKYSPWSDWKTDGC